MLGLELLATDLELDLSCGVRTTFMQSGRRTDLSRVRAGYLRPYDARAFLCPQKLGLGVKSGGTRSRWMAHFGRGLILRPSTSLIGPGTGGHSSDGKSRKLASRYLKR
jgi:hypothetical protein